MDDDVIRAMARWPNVPAVYGWMSLDRRGRWCLEGKPVGHRRAVEFMNRNYACEQDGRWYFQNGPQRVYVDLDYTPWVVMLDGSRSLRYHTGDAVEDLGGAWLDEEGNFLVLGDRGIALVCDRDLDALSKDLRLAGGAPCDEESLSRLVESPGGEHDGVHLVWREHRIPLAAIARDAVAARFRFEPRPRCEDG